MTMAELDGELWAHNLARVIVVDVTDDYRLMQPSLPPAYYPVLAELWLPRAGLLETIVGRRLVEGHLYDWHYPADEEGEVVYVGVVQDDWEAASAAPVAPPTVFLEATRESGP